MGAGAKSEAVRLALVADQTIESIVVGRQVDDEVKRKVARLLDHGISRRVDHRIRQVRPEPNAWTDVTADRVAGVVAVEPGMVVLLGSHRSGHVRQAAVELATSWIIDPATAEADPPERRKPAAGVARMLAQRSFDPAPPVSDAARSLVATLFSLEQNSGYQGRMPTGVERAAREVVGQSRSVSACPELVMAALDLFETRVGRYSAGGARDHHRHTLQEVDRRAQVLAELEKLIPELEDPESIAASARLVDFYQRSLQPVRHHEPTEEDR